ncbi:hypothetical protein [Pontibacillus litoralis]|uniref:Uncharacterized protein n=1 Tax=Pontibacillus litoralis JSM 072002 TaxID=1385512 RepID=A0A0A5I002_9BACI|nr:hypothetical protein [Pontibacillus litoralis]KGX89187.1 hypothetical protein N784_00605 [Pontibacillus litoralis JSM 072002]
MRMIVWLFMLITVLYAVSKYKYKLLNALFTIEAVRKMAVRWSMEIPLVRERILSQVVPSSLVK